MNQTNETPIWVPVGLLLATALLLSVIGGAAYGVYFFFGAKVAVVTVVTAAILFGWYQGMTGQPVEDKSTSDEWYYDPDTGVTSPFPTSASSFPVPPIC